MTDSDSNPAIPDLVLMIAEYECLEKYGFVDHRSRDRITKGQPFVCKYGKRRPIHANVVAERPDGHGHHLYILACQAATVPAITDDD